MPKTVAVHGWPHGMARAVEALLSAQALTVISVPMPATTSRVLARQCIREALRETIAAVLGQPADSVVLRSQPGHAVEVDSPWMPLQVSVSHMPGLSVAAIGRQARLGIDVMPVGMGLKDMPDWPRVARDYLGPAVARQLHRTPPALRAAAFAEAWTRFEACLKCRGLPLTEWTPALAHQGDACQVRGLDLPEHCRGAIAQFTPGPAQGSAALPRL